MKQAGTMIRAVSEGVLLDLVVRDREGRPIPDLRQEEIEILEDGQRQEILSFRYVGDSRIIARDSSASSSSPTSGQEGGSAVPGPAGRVRFDPFKHVNLVALVFERLPDTARNMARQAALHFLDSGMQENTLVAVFAIENRLNLVEHYTNNREALREAVLKATSGAFGLFDSQSTDTIQGQMKEITREMDRSLENAPVEGGPGVTPEMNINWEAGLEEMTLNILRQAERMMMYQRGHATISSLQALVHEEAKLAGRKTLALFSAGIQIPHEVVNRYRTLISEANRGNVSIYTIDARGLTSEETMADTKEMLNQAVTTSREQMLLGVGHFVTRDETLIDEYAETSLRLSAHGTLDDLARSTGGFLVANTNDPRALIDRVSEDIRSYYEVAYKPQNVEYDGKFRQITVKVSRPGATVQSRSGYFALPPNSEAPIQPFEIPMLVALNSATIPQDFSYRSRVLHFDYQPEGRRHVIVVEVPLATFRFVSDTAKRLYNTRFSILVLVKNEEDQVVAKFTQDYPLQGPLDKFDMVRDGSVVFMREAVLPPGTYTVESAVADQLSHTASARRALLRVYPADGGLTMSSVSIIRRVDPASEKAVPDPFLCDEGRIVPNLAGTMVKRADRSVGIFFSIYPKSEAGETPRITLDILKDGKTVARGRPEVPPASSEGWIRFVGSVPLTELDSGRYELRAVVQQGTHAVKEHAFFAIDSAGVDEAPLLN